MPEHENHHHHLEEYMRIAILQANLGGFDTPQDPVEQDTEHEITFHRWTDENFPPITGLTGRMQYRIPKTHGWEMFPGYDVYMWLDGSVSLKRPDCIEWYLAHLGKNDMALFKHPVRRYVRQEVDHIEEHLNLGKPYITARYKGGLHKEQYEKMLADPTYKDRTLYASTAFMYRNNKRVQRALKDWWYEGTRYFTCDQVVLPYIIHKHKLRVSRIDENQYKIGYLSLVSHHR